MAGVHENGSMGGCLWLGVQGQGTGSTGGCHTTQPLRCSCVQPRCCLQVHAPQAPLLLFAVVLWRASACLSSSTAAPPSLCAAAAMENGFQVWSFSGQPLYK